MMEYLILILNFAPSLFLIPGACTVAIWALRLPDAQSSLVAKLTGERDASGSHGTRSEPSWQSDYRGASSATNSPELRE
jgi:hypothetical protein